MKYEYFNPGEVNCVVRSISKILNKNYIDVEKELIELSKKLNYDTYSETEVFEKYLEQNSFFELNKDYNDQIKKYKFDGENIVFCYDKKDFFHLVAIIDNVIYDKKEGTENLYIIKIYKRRN